MILQIGSTSADIRPMKTMPQTWDLTYCAAKANEFHARALESWQTGLEHAKAAGDYLLAAKKQTGHGNWRSWLERNFKGKERTARVYMQIAKHWTAIEQDPNRSINEALKTLTVKRRPHKDFDLADILKNASFRAMVREAIRGWSRDEKEALEIDPDVQAEFLSSMKRVRKNIRRRNGKWTEEEIREELKQASDRYQLRLRTQREAIEELTLKDVI